MAAALVEIMLGRLRRARAVAMMSAMTSNEFDALLERRRELEASIRRARGVLSRKPDARLEAACTQAVRLLVDVRARIEAELDQVRSRARRLRHVG